MNQYLKKCINALRVVDPDVKDVAWGAMQAFILRVTGSGLAFIFNVTVARLLGAEGAGLYFLALSISIIGSEIGRVGLDNALLRFVATHAAHREWDMVSGVHALGIRLAVAVSSVITIIGFLMADSIASLVLKKPELSEPLRWMSLSILPHAILNLQASSLKGLKRIRAAMAVQSIGLPLIGLLLILPFTSVASVEMVCWAYFAATVLVAFAGSWAWSSKKGVFKNVEGSCYPLETLLVSCKPLYVISLMNVLLNWAPLLLLGIWASSEEVGVFGAATRLMVLVSFLLMTLNNVIAPKFAEMYAKGDLDAIERIARSSTAVLILIVSPIFLLSFIFSREIMQLFGPEFGVGDSLLIILLIGQLFNIFTGPVGFLLMMSGNESYIRNITIMSAALQLLLIVILAPIFGGEGAAIATAVALTSKNFASVVAIYRKFGIVTIPVLHVFFDGGFRSEKM